jgi:hydrogenase maturation protease
MHALVMGVGNVLWADEGFGVRAVELFDQRYACDDQVTLVDGGTRGMALLPFVQACDLLVLFDAVDFGLHPGTLHLVRDADVPAFLGAKKMSLHQTGFQEVLALAELTGEAPQHLLLIGMQPELLEDYGGGLTETVAAGLDRAVAIAADDLRRHGFSVAARATTSDGLGPAALDRLAYEGQRPSAEEACRIGDARFLNL